MIPGGGLPWVLQFSINSIVSMLSQAHVVQEQPPVEGEPVTCREV
jgi:hypothetical protein